jgi:hypothetical protein
MEERTRAKRLLVHYFRLLSEKAGLQFDGDNVAEIEEIVDRIVEAARESIASERRNANG